MGFLDLTLPNGIARKTKNAYQRGKLVGVLLCGPEDMPPDLASASAKWEVTLWLVR